MSLLATILLGTLAAIGLVRDQKPMHLAYAVAAVIACTALFIATAGPV